GNGNGKGNGHANVYTNGHAGSNGNGHAALNRMESTCPTAPAKKIHEGDVKDCCGDGVAESTLQKNGAAKPQGAPSPAASGETPPANFEEFIYKIWGAGIAKHFAIPYNRKLWAVPLSEMETSWLGGRVPMPDLEEM